MYLFFCVYGFLFVSVFANIKSYLNELFPDNKIVEFISPVEDSLWNSINSLVVPTTIWSIIELPVLGKCSHFSIGFLLNIIVGCGIIYVVKNFFEIVLKKDNKTVNIIANIVGAAIGFFLSYLFLIISKNGNVFISIVTVLGFLILLILVYIFPPKSFFFEIKKNKKLK